MMGLLPLIGVVLFVIAAIPIAFGDRAGDWQRELVENGVFYKIGWAGLGPGISHLFFGKTISASIGFEKSPFEFEVGFADLAMGITGLMAQGQNKEFWLAIIVTSSIFRVGCGTGHIRQIVREQNYAPNNTVVLFTNFVVPAFLVLTYLARA